jgi:hypothetical protein
LELRGHDNLLDLVKLFDFLSESPNIVLLSNPIFRYQKSQTVSEHVGKIEQISAGSHELVSAR